MSTSTSHSDDRLPTAGPASGCYERYRCEDTTDGETLIYDIEIEDAWVQSSATMDLETWR